MHQFHDDEAFGTGAWIEKRAVIIFAYIYNSPVVIWYSSSCILIYCSIVREVHDDTLHGHSAAIFSSIGKVFRHRFFVF